jgi:hypothetical protein
VEPQTGNSGGGTKTGGDKCSICTVGVVVPHARHTQFSIAGNCSSGNDPGSSIISQVRRRQCITGTPCRHGGDICDMPPRTFCRECHNTQPPRSLPTAFLTRSMYNVLHGACASWSTVDSWALLRLTHDHAKRKRTIAIVSNAFIARASRKLFVLQTYQDGRTACCYSNVRLS